MPGEIVFWGGGLETLGETMPEKVLGKMFLFAFAFI